MTPRAPLLAVVAALGLAGCMVGPRYRAAPPAVPAAFAGADPDRARAPASRPVSRSEDIGAWWRAFHDPELDRLVERALGQNLDRQTAAARVREARQTAVAARAGLYPQVDANGSATHTRISQNAGLSSLGSLPGGGGGSGGGGGLASAGAPGLEFDTFQLGLDGSFDLDLFGGKRRAARAARDRAEAEVWSARDTDVAVTSELARAYLQLRADQASLEVVRAAARAQGDLLQVLDARARGGLTTEVDIVEQRRQLAATQAQAPPLEASIEAGRHQIALLLGEAPEALDGELTAAAAAPAPPPEIPVGLPSDLLKRRPDVRRAERQLAAAVEDVGQATAALYPSVTLTGSFSFLSSELKTLLDADSRNETIAAQLTAPLFDAGRLRAQRRATEARAEQAAIAYRLAVLSGLREVADALSRYAADQRRLATLEAALAAGRRAVALDRSQYLGGLSDFQATLRAEAAALQTEQDLAQTRAQLFGDLVTLYRALGGAGRPANPQ